MCSAEPSEDVDTTVAINVADLAYYMRRPKLHVVFVAQDRSSSADALILPKGRVKLRERVDPSSGRPLTEEKKFRLELALQLKGNSCPSPAALAEEIEKCVPPAPDSKRFLTLLYLSGGDPPTKMGVDIIEDRGVVLGKYLAPGASYPTPPKKGKKLFIVPTTVEVIIPNRSGLESLFGKDLTGILWPIESPAPPSPRTPESSSKVRAQVNKFTSPMKP